MAVSADLCFKTNDSNQCQFSCPINVAAAVNDDEVDASFAVDDDSYIESTAAVDDAPGSALPQTLWPTSQVSALRWGEIFLLQTIWPTSQASALLWGKIFLLLLLMSTLLSTTSMIFLLLMSTLLSTTTLKPLLLRKKMPKRKHKFGKGAKRGGDRKSCRHVLPTALVDPTAIALVDPTALVARERLTPIPVKQMNKKQLHRSLHCTTKKLVCAKKKAVTTSKKLTASKAQCTILAKLAQDRRKESNLAHQKATSEVNAIRAEAEKSIHFAESEIALRPPLPLGFPLSASTMT